MLINNNIQAVTGAYNVSSTGGARRNGAVDRAHKADEVVFSSEAQTFSNMLQKLRGMDENRAERVEALRQQVADGTYEVDSKSLADRLLDTRF